MTSVQLKEEAKACVDPGTFWTTRLHSNL